MTFRAPLAVVLAGLVALLPLLPREHVHAVAHEGGRATTVAHRHAAPHRHDHSAAAPGGPHQHVAQAPSHQHQHPHPLSHRHPSAAARPRTAHAHTTGRPAHVQFQNAAHRHRHESTAGPQAAHASGHARDDEPSIDHEASVVTELSPAFAAPEERLLHAPAALVHLFVTQADGRPVGLTVNPFVERLIHGPPSSPTASRPPPSQTHL